jgi:AraC family transcriptional regulator
MTADLVAKARKLEPGARDHGAADSTLVQTGSGGGPFAFQRVTVGFVFSPLKRHEAAYGTAVARDVPLAPGAGWLLPAGIDGACEWSGDSLFLNVSFSPDLLSDITGGKGLDFAPRYAFMDATAANIALDLHAADSAGPMAAIYRQSMTMALAAHLAKALMETAPPVTQAPVLEDARLARAVDLIEARLAEAPSLDDLASAAGMSPFHFARSFRKATGEAPHRFLMRRRIERAKILLATTPLPVAEIGWRVGWQNAAHFTQAFRAMTGMTPGAYRAG